MQPTDREHFETHMGVLCAGFNVPATAERLEAYWTGLSRMPISAFVRCVEHALGEMGPEKIPTTSQIWAIHRQSRAVRLDSNVPRKAGPAGEPLSMFGQRMLLNFIGDPRRPQGASSHSLAELIDAKNRLVESYRGLLAEAAANGEEPPTDAEMIATMHRRFATLFEPMSSDELAELQRRHGHGTAAPQQQAQAA